MLIQTLKTAATAVALAAAVSAQAAPVQWTVASGGNGHWYDYIAAPVGATGFTWDSALAHAPTQSNLGQAGYLATITSQQEQDFIFLNVTRTTAWLGGNDRALEGTWVWQTGPEAGQAFFVVGAASQPGYSFWNSGEPNNCCSGEDDLQFAWSSDGRWNDHGTPSSPNATWGYVIEYADVPGTQIPEPTTLVLLGSALLSLGLRRRRG